MIVTNCMPPLINWETTGVSFSSKSCHLLLGHAGWHFQSWLERGKQLTHIERLTCGNITRKPGCVAEDTKLCVWQWRKDKSVTEYRTGDMLLSSYTEYLS